MYGIILRSGLDIMAKERGINFFLIDVLEVFSQNFILPGPQNFFRFLIPIGHHPIFVDGEKSIADTFQNGVLFLERLRERQEVSFFVDGG